MAGLLLLILSVATALNITEEQYGSFPRLFHLDDYERCLANQQGLYCIGTATLAAAERNSTFELMKAYSDIPFNFNRTRLYRGYCVSERCPREKNATRRFERCVAKRVRRYSLSARLHAVECTTNETRQAEATRAPDAAQLLFIFILYAIVVLNVLGTVCDVNSKPGDNKWRLLKCWSVPSNWRRMVNSINMNDVHIKALAPLQGLRAIAAIIVLTVHVTIGRLMMYAYHPHYLEELLQSGYGRVVTSVVGLQATFIVMSSFLTAYFIITMPGKNEGSLKVLLLGIIRRVIRISPTNVFMVGYAATWWYYLGDGPLWSSIVGANRNNCHQKFWAHAFFVNNLVDNSSGYCLVPTWFIAADLHVHMVVSALTLIMARWGRKALFVHAMLLAISCALITALTYANEWKSMLYIAGPDNVRTMFHEEPCYHHLYMSSWILLPASFCGMFYAHLHVELQKVGFRPSEHKWLRQLFNLTLPVFIVWMLVGSVRSESPIMMALLVGFHRPMLSVIIGLILVLSFNFQEHVISKFLSWKFWHVLSRLSLPVMMVHWLVLMTMVGATRHAMSTTIWDMMADSIVVVVISYVVSVPVTVFLEIPAQRFLETLLFRHKVKAS